MLHRPSSYYGLHINSYVATRILVHVEVNKKISVTYMCACPYLTVILSLVEGLHCPHFVTYN